MASTTAISQHNSVDLVDFMKSEDKLIVSLPFVKNSNPSLLLFILTSRNRTWFFGRKRAERSLLLPG
ncbi:hypothetical protein WA026_006397 [Henosepilachna vigintioctopunctata]|uniref:Uncharacterized protein n=1 Tax=Henosepilachna vigintioctopunctata TaxID=420089 RepID=A0AAW1TI99_9CUCU